MAPAEIELQYDGKLAAAGFPSPVLRGSIRGQPAWFLIDTGASVHTLASWFVTAAGVATHTTKATTKGSTGIETAVRTVYGEAIRVPGRKDEIPLREAIVTELPAIFKEQRIAGLVSPQLFAPASTAAILDLRAPRLSFGPPPAPSMGTRVCRNPDSPFTNRLYAAPVWMDAVESLMLVDTGATSSVAMPSSRIAAALNRRASVAGHTQGVGGTATATRKVLGVALKFGGGGATVSMTIGVAPSVCGGGGLLGMDALRGCRLVLGESAFAWSCGPAF